MRKWIAGSVVVIFCLVLINCGGSNDPKVVVNDFMDIFEGYINNMEKADSADAVVKAMDTFTNKMEDMIPRMKAVQEAHPEFKEGFEPGKMPKGFEEQEKRMQEMMPKMMGMGAKMMQYGSDPKVQEAQKRFTEVMQKMQ